MTQSRFWPDDYILRMCKNGFESALKQVTARRTFARTMQAHALASYAMKQLSPHDKQSVQCDIKHKTYAPDPADVRRYVQLIWNEGIRRGILHEPQ